MRRKDRPRHRCGPRHRRSRPPAACTGGAPTSPSWAWSPRSSSATRRRWATARRGSRPTSPTSRRSRPRWRGTVERFGGIDVVVANAGVAPHGTVASIDPALFDQHDRGQPARRLPHRPRRAPPRRRAPGLRPHHLVGRGARPHAAHGRLHRVQGGRRGVRRRAARRARPHRARRSASPTSRSSTPTWSAELRAAVGADARGARRRRRSRKVAPLSEAIDAIEGGIAAPRPLRRARRSRCGRCSWLRSLHPAAGGGRRRGGRRLEETIRLAEAEPSDLTTPQPRG